MRKHAFLLIAALLAAFATFNVTPAFAQATRTWVSGVGDDANPCSRTAPCKTFAGAISKTAAGGEIDVLDPGGFGGVTITKSITIDGSGGSIAGVLVAGTNGITINDSGAGTIIVTLRNLDIEGLGLTTGSPGIRGISFVSGAALHVQRCLVRNFRDAVNGTGISFTPSKTAELYVEDTVITGNGILGGILIKPTGGTSSKASIIRTNVENNTLGIRADSTGGPATLATTISDSVVSGNTNSGITAFTAAAGGVANTVMVNRTMVSNNSNGLNANGNAAIMRVGYSVITGQSGASVSIANSATLTSYNNNQIDDNGSAPVIPTTPLH